MMKRPAGGRIAWLPGRNAPSLDPAALSPELLGALSYAPGTGRFIVSANLGYRLDRSARTATDAPLLGPGDRVALDVSAFNSVLVGAAASLRLGPAQAFLEGSWNLLVGAGSPKPMASPMRVGGGVRLALGPRVDLEFQADVSPSLRPDLADPMAALIPVPPRFAAGLGLVYRFTAPPSPARSPVVLAASPPPARRRSRPGGTGGGRGRHRLGARPGDHGGRERAARCARHRHRRREPATIVVDGEGRFTVEGAPGDELVIAVEAKGFLPVSQPVTLAAGPPAELAIDLRRTPPGGQLRGFVRSFRGSAVDAEIVVDDNGTELRASHGRFEVDVTPGMHEVRISARGYVTQVRRVHVEQDGVTLLNIDLKRAP